MDWIDRKLENWENELIMLYRVIWVDNRGLVVWVDWNFVCGLINNVKK